MSYAVKPVTVRRGLAGRLAAAGKAVAEVFTREPSTPWLPVALYLPFAVAGVLWNLPAPRPSAWAFLLLPPAGLLFWTLFEYVMHSEAFHRQTRLHFLREFQASHLRHHDNPKHAGYIVARLSTSLPLAVVLYSLFALVLWSWRLAALPLAGLVVGYLGYEVVHYGIHRWRRVRWLLRPLVKHHLYHHYKDDTRCFGVTTPLWDWVFRTGRRAKAQAASQKC